MGRGSVRNCEVIFCTMEGNCAGEGTKEGRRFLLKEQPAMINAIAELEGSGHGEEM
jgi:hypothetical protein